MFKVKKCFGRSETQAADCVTEKEAMNFIMQQLSDDKNYKLNATYRLYEGADLLQEFSQKDLPDSKIAAEDASGSAAGKGSRQVFAPTPLNTRPHLGPRSYIKDEEPGEDEGK